MLSTEVLVGPRWKSEEWPSDGALVPKLLRIGMFKFKMLCVFHWGCRDGSAVRMTCCPPSASELSSLEATLSGFKTTYE